MGDKESEKLLVEIRDEIKEMNAHFRWFRTQAEREFKADPESEEPGQGRFGIDTKKLKTELVLLGVFAAIFAVGYTLNKLGYL